MLFFLKKSPRFVAKIACPSKLDDDSHDGRAPGCLCCGNSQAEEAVEDMSTKRRWTKIHKKTNETTEPTAHK
jgi:hypothetical protein